jgi:hypothetical protein
MPAPSRSKHTRIYDTGGTSESDSLLNGLLSTFSQAFGRDMVDPDDRPLEYQSFPDYYRGVFQWELPRHFHTALDALLDPDTREMLLLVPPGHGKSSFMSAYNAWVMGRDPNLTTMVATHTLTYSQRLVEYICTLLAHPVSRHSFGDLIPKSSSNVKWTLDQRYLVRTDHRIKDPSFTTAAVGSATIGYRCRMIFADDLVTQTNSMTPVMRGHISNWYWNSLEKRLDPGGKIAIIGTPFYKGDLYGEMRERGYTVVEMPSTPEAPLWPSRFDSKALAHIESKDRKSFKAQYRLEPEDGTEGVLSSRWLYYYLVNPPNMRYYIGVDPCAKDKAGTDPMGLAVIGVDDNDTVYVVETIARQATMRAQARLVVDKMKQYKPVLTGIEVNGSQQALYDELVEMKVYEGKLHAVQTQLPKPMRIGAMGNTFRNKRALVHGETVGSLIAPHPLCAEFVNEWNNYPASGDHVLDAVEIAISTALDVGIKPAAAIVAYERGAPTINETMGGAPNQEESSDHVLRHSARSLFH